VMGVTFTAMGLGTMMFPVSGLGLFIDPSIHAYCFTGNEVNPVAKLLWQCFGAQATLCGVLILSCKFTKKTFRNFGLAIIPFFAFDYLAYRAGYPFGSCRGFDWEYCVHYVELFGISWQSKGINNRYIQWSNRLQLLV
jgi:hypothetical protein